METTTHIRNSKKTYYNRIILSSFFYVCCGLINNLSLSATASSSIGIICIVVILYSLYKLFLGKSKIILSEFDFKVEGYDWINWDDLLAIYPFVEQNAENGAEYYIRFRLTDGTDLPVRSEDLEMSFEQIAELVNQYKADYQNKK